ncbi:MAG: ABC transporter substrate-binding protein [Acidimicrobiales bacterium]
MKRPALLRAGAALIALGAVTAACGSDSGEEASETTKAGASATTAGGAAAGGNIANTVAGENPASWGVKDKKLTGPGGFTVDLSKCPANWKDTGGVTDTEIRIGATVILSGSAAPYGAYALSTKAYFDYVNKTEGGVAGKKVVFDFKDSGYEAARAKAGMDELLETGNLFAVAGNHGFPTGVAVYDKLNEQCMPNVYPISASPAWGDPVHHPWTVGAWLGYDTEARLWAKHIKDKFGAGATIAGLAWNNDYGQIYKSVFEKAAKEEGLVVSKIVFHEGSAPNVTNEMTTLAATNADVFIGMTGSPYCIQAMQHISGSAWRPKEKMVSQTCNSLAAYKSVGEGAVGWIHAGQDKDSTDAQFANDPGMKLWKDALAAGGVDNVGFAGKGMTFAWPVIENLKRASQMSGGLTRTNFLNAVRSHSAVHPALLDGIKWETNGSKDAFPIEGTVWRSYKFDAATSNGTFESVGAVIDLNGTTPHCVWDGKACQPD